MGRGSTAGCLLVSPTCRSGEATAGGLVLSVYLVCTCICLLLSACLDLCTCFLRRNVAMLDRSKPLSTMSLAQLPHLPDLRICIQSIEARVTIFMHLIKRIAQRRHVPRHSSGLSYHFETLLFYVTDSGTAAMRPPYQSQPSRSFFRRNSFD